MGITDDVERGRVCEAAGKVYPSIHRLDNSENSNVKFGLTHQKQTNKDIATICTEKCIHVHILMLFLYGLSCIFG